MWGEACTWHEIQKVKSQAPDDTNKQKNDTTYAAFLRSWAERLANLLTNHNVAAAKDHLTFHLHIILLIIFTGQLHCCLHIFWQSLPRSPRLYNHNGNICANDNGITPTTRTSNGVFGNVGICIRVLVANENGWRHYTNFVPHFLWTSGNNNGNHYGSMPDHGVYLGATETRYLQRIV